MVAGRPFNHPFDRPFGRPSASFAARRPRKGDRNEDEGTRDRKPGPARPGSSLPRENPLPRKRPSPGPAGAAHARRASPESALNRDSHAAGPPAGEHVFGDRGRPRTPGRRCRRALARWRTVSAVQAGFSLYHGRRPSYSCSSRTL